MGPTPDKAPMFTLGDSEFPTDNESLQKALEAYITRMGGRPGGVELDGMFPSFAAIRLNMTGARFPAKFWHTPEAEGETRTFSTRLMEITGTPAMIDELRFILTFRAEDCVFVCGKAEDGTRLINAQNCVEGETIITATTEEIGKFLQGAAEKAASAHGAHIQSVNISLESPTAWSVAAKATAVAKAMLFTATLNFEGRLEVGGNLEVRFRDLRCNGTGMLATLAANFVRNRIEQLEGKRIPITRCVPRDNPIRNVVLQSEGGFRMRISFGIKREPR